MSELLRFCVVGAIGFVVDAGVLMLLVAGAGMNPYAARVFSFLAAATSTWWLNRRYTFAVARPGSRREWIRYMALMTLGAAVNYGAFALTLMASAVARQHPWIGVAAGAIAGLGLNFLTSRSLLKGA